MNSERYIRLTGSERLSHGDGVRSAEVEPSEVDSARRSTLSPPEVQPDMVIAAVRDAAAVSAASVFRMISLKAVILSSGMVNKLLLVFAEKAKIYAGGARRRLWVIL